MDFEIYEFSYYDKKTNQVFVVYARTEETAKQIIDIVNDEDDIFFFIKKCFRRFKRKIATHIPPYELETKQFNLVETQRKRRIEYCKKHQENLNKLDK